MSAVQFIYRERFPFQITMSSLSTIYRASSSPLFFIASIIFYRPFSLFNSISNREYPCDHYTSVINVTLLMTGCPRVNVHSAAIQLLQILDKRFFAAVGPLQGENDKGMLLAIINIINTYMHTFSTCINIYNKYYTSVSRIS